MSSRGRQKIEIKRIENQAARQVAFTKRRQGVIKKASDLSVLCGAEVAILAFSPAGRPFSFGQPSVDAVVSRFLSRSRGPAVSVGGSTSSGGMTAEWLNLRYMEIQQQLEAEREKKAAAKERLRAAVSAVGVMEKALAEQDMEELGVAGLEAAKRVMVEARLRVEARQKEVLLAVAPRLMSGAVAARPISVVAPPGAIAGGGIYVDDGGGELLWRR